MVEQSSLTAYKVNQICYHLEHLAILIVPNLSVPFKLLQVTKTSGETVGCQYLGLL